MTQAKVYSGMTMAPQVMQHMCYSKEACQYATEAMLKISAYSGLSDKSVNNVSLIDRSEIVLGDLLGSGGFNDVFELQRISLQQGDPESDDENDDSFQEHQKARRQLSKKAQTGHEQLAVKFLKEEVTTESEKFCVAAADLMIEARYLGILSHENIVSLHGISAAGVSGFADQGIDGYFIILDRLYDTLDKRLEFWKGLQKGGADQNKEGSSKDVRKAVFTQRLQVGKGLCSALQHLHKFNIIFRDLKPENVGFDMMGTVKLFDFGLARELDPREKMSDGTYKMTGQTGSRMYMAPEVVKGEKYNLSADVYSFGLILWQLCALDDPYTYMDINDHMDYVVNWNFRPKVDDTWPSALCLMMEMCWSKDLFVRPVMKEVYKVLTKEIRTIRKSGSDAHHSRKKVIG